MICAENYFEIKLIESSKVEYIITVLVKVIYGIITNKVPLFLRSYKKWIGLFLLEENYRYRWQGIISK